MEARLKTPARHFTAAGIRIADCGDIVLAADEQVTLVTEQGRRHDFTAKNWGFYATPSINRRLKAEGFKTALVRNGAGAIFVMVVAEDRRREFDAYCREQCQVVLEWLDERPLAPSP